MCKKILFLSLIILSQNFFAVHNQKKPIVKRDPISRVISNSKKIVLPALVLTLAANLPTADGGPVVGAACGLVCGLVTTMGCTAGSLVMLTLSPAASALYASACAYLVSYGSVAACTSACLALPTP